MTEAARQPVYVFEGFRLDAQRRVLHDADGQPIPLTPRLIDTLLYFVEHAGQLLTKEQLMEALWPRVVVEEHNLNKTVSELRRVLGEKPGEHRFIVTKPGHGYRFVADVTLVPPSQTLQRDEGFVVAELKVRRASAARRWGAAALGVVALAFVLYALFGPATDPALRATPWASDKRGQWYPVWSLDGTEIAWATRSTETEPADLYIRAVDEPVPRSIARRPGKIPAITQWTSDNKILFWEFGGLWSVSPVGGTPELAVPLDFRALGMFPPMRTTTISRDGSTMATVRAGEGISGGIWTATPPSAAFERYDPAPFAATGYHNAPFLRFSPDGKRLLLVWYPAGRGGEAWLLPFPADSSNPPRRVLEDLPLAVGEAEFSWFPDNRHIVVATGREGELERRLYVADTLSGKFRVLVDELTGQLGVPVVSPDGSQLLFSHVKRDFDTVTIDLHSGQLTDSIVTNRSEAMPSWASAAKAMVYVTDRNGVWEVWLKQSERSDGPLVTKSDFPTTESLYFIAPMLSPNGARVIFDRVETEHPGARLWMLAVDGGAPQLLTNEDGVEEYAGSWSHDGDWFAYLSSAPEEDGLQTLKRAKTTGQATPETLLKGVVGGAAAPIWSPDGKWILVSNGTMRLVSVQDKTTRDLGIEDSVCAFADGEPFLYCIRDTRPSEEHPLIKLDFEGNVVERIATLPRANMPAAPRGPGLRLSLTPERTSATYSVERTTEVLFLLDGLDTIELP